MIQFSVSGLPIPKARARTMTLPNGRSHTYTPDKTAAWETAIRLQARRYHPSELLDGPLQAELTFYLPKPKSTPKRVTYPATKPDLDNLAKSVFDALEGILFTNDSRIVDKVLHKRFGDPRVEIAIGPVEGGLSDGPGGEIIPGGARGDHGRGGARMDHSGDASLGVEGHGRADAVPAGARAGVRRRAAAVR